MTLWEEILKCGIVPNKLPTIDQLHEAMMYVEENVCNTSSTKFPTLDQVVSKAPLNAPVSIESVSIGSSFPYKKGPVPQIVIEESATSTTPSQLGYHSPTNLSEASLMHLLPPDAFNLRDIISRKSIFRQTLKISRGSHLGGIRHTIDQIHRYIREYQLESFMKKLKKKGYVSKRTIPQLASEILLRKKQFPGTKIYVFTGNDLAYYMRKMYETNRWNGAWLTSERTVDRWSWNRGILKDLESAVVSETQRNADHSIEF